MQGTTTDAIWANSLYACIHTISESFLKSYKVNMKINDISLEMEIDTGGSSEHSRLAEMIGLLGLYLYHF